jgi:hypothetical protein
MRKYLVSYQMLNDFQVVVSAEDEDQAKDLVVSSATPTSFIEDAEGFECEPDWMQSDIYYDTIDVMETE